MDILWAMLIIQHDIAWIYRMLDTPMDSYLREELEEELYYLYEDLEYLEAELEYWEGIT